MRQIRAVPSEQAYSVVVGGGTGPKGPFLPAWRVVGGVWGVPPPRARGMAGWLAGWLAGGYPRLAWLAWLAGWLGWLSGPSPARAKPWLAVARP